MIQEFLESQIFLLAATAAFYCGGMALYRRTGSSLCHPVVITFIAMIGLLRLFDIPYERYREATRLLDFGLGMSVVALGYLLYEQEERMKGQVLSILTSITLGCLVGILSVVYIAKWFGATRMIQNSIAMKSVTVPIAVTISENIGGDMSITSVVVFVVGIFGALIGGGDMSITSVVVFVVGIFGALIGFAFMRILKIDDPMARGLAMGSAAHGIGTARSIEEGAVEGALSGLAMALMGVATALLAPLLERFLY